MEATTSQKTVGSCVGSAGKATDTGQNIYYCKLCKRSGVRFRGNWEELAEHCVAEHSATYRPHGARRAAFREPTPIRPVTAPAPLPAEAAPEMPPAGPTMPVEPATPTAPLEEPSKRKYTRRQRKEHKNQLYNMLETTVEEGRVPEVELFESMCRGFMALKEGLYRSRGKIKQLESAVARLEQQNRELRLRLETNKNRDLNTTLARARHSLALPGDISLNDEVFHDPARVR